MLALLPVLLIALAVIANTFFPGESIVKKVILFIGDATIALLISVLLAVFILGIAKGRSMQQVMQWLNDSVAGVAVILLIITAGGVFKQVLIDSGTADLYYFLQQTMEYSSITICMGDNRIVKSGNWLSNCCRNNSSRNCFSFISNRNSLS